MSTSKNHSRSLVTPEMRMSFPAMIIAKPYMENGKPTGKESYQVEGIFDEDALNRFMMHDEGQKKYVPVSLPHILVQLATEAWPGINVKETFERQIGNDGKGGKGWPIKRGDVIAELRAAKGKKGDAYVGKRVISFKSNKADNVNPPTLSMVVGKNSFKTLSRASDVDMEKAKQLFVGGNYAFGTVSFVATVVAGTKFLVPYINGLRYTREGERLGGQSEMDRFDGYSGGASDHNPTQGMDEEIPF